VLRKGHILAILVIGVSVVSILSISAEEGLIPAWIKNSAKFWVDGQTSDQEFLTTIEWLIENDFMKIASQDDEWKAEAGKLYKENQQLKKEISDLKEKDTRLQRLTQPYYDPAPKSSRIQSQDCSGTASCFTGDVTAIIDGDTIKVDGNSIRFALVDTPEIGEYGYGLAKDFVAKICPLGSIALVDEDDKQTQGSYGRMIAIIYCNGMNLNKAVLDQGYGKIDTYFCTKSEFEYDGWAQTHGCAAKKTQQYTPPKSEPPKAKTEPPKTEPPKTEPPKSEPPETTTPNCDPSYPTVCIPPPPPDLDCGEITYRNFKVLQPDPHRFDGDKDGIGCES